MIDPRIYEMFRDIGRDLFVSNMISSHGGNLSIRLGDRVIGAEGHPGDEQRIRRDAEREDGARGAREQRFGQREVGRSAGTVRQHDGARHARTRRGQPHPSRFAPTTR